MGFRVQIKFYFTLLHFSTENCTSQIQCKNQVLFVYHILEYLHPTSTTTTITNLLKIGKKITNYITFPPQVPTFSHPMSPSPLFSTPQRPGILSPMSPTHFSHSHCCLYLGLSTYSQTDP